MTRPRALLAAWLAAVVVSVLWTSHARAHPMVPRPAANLKAREGQLERALAHHVYVARNGRPGAFWTRGHAMRASWVRQNLRRVQRALNRSEGVPSWALRAFLCIHRHEGAWNDPNPPYYGGLQMDMAFQRSYGPEYLRRYGTADNWPPSVQIAVAYRAVRSGRGFYPWPNAARRCGLL